MVRIVVVALAFFVFSNPLKAQVFPANCGRFVLQGILFTSPNRVVLWQGTASEKIIQFSGECRECEILNKHPVEIDVSILSEKAVAKKNTKLRAISLFSGLNSSSAVREKEAFSCKN